MIVIKRKYDDDTKDILKSINGLFYATSSIKIDTNNQLIQIGVIVKKIKYVPMIEVIHALYDTHISIEFENLYDLYKFQRENF